MAAAAERQFVKRTDRKVVRQIVIAYGMVGLQQIDGQGRTLVRALIHALAVSEGSQYLVSRRKPPLDLHLQGVVGRISVRHAERELAPLRVRPPRLNRSGAGRRNVVGNGDQLLMGRLVA